MSDEVDELAVLVATVGWEAAAEAAMEDLERLELLLADHLRHDEVGQPAWSCLIIKEELVKQIAEAQDRMRELACLNDTT